MTQEIKPFVARLEKVCTKIGKNNKATYPVIAIASVKGICRPAFTMMDKTEKPETKRYTALREGLTELIAIPTYLFCGETSAWLAKKFIKESSESQKAAKNLMFLGVCGAALFVIPALCSVVINPIVKNFINKQKQKTNKSDMQNLYAEPNFVQFPRAFNNFGGKTKFSDYNYNQKFYTGLKVGGL